MTTKTARMPKAWLVIAAMLVVPFCGGAMASAQDSAPRDEMHAHGRRGGMHGRGMGRHGPAARLEMLTAILGLDEHQVTAIREIFQANRPRRQEIFQMTDPAARQAAMTALHDQTRAQIDALLTPDQRATFDRVEAVRRAHAGGGPGPRGGGPGPHGAGLGHRAGPGPRGRAPTAPAGI